MAEMPTELPYAGRCSNCGRDCVWWDGEAVCLKCKDIESDCQCSPTGEKILDVFMAGG